MTFLAGDRTPYTYCITHKITGLSYYGRNAARGCHPKNFWVTYFTTSNIVKQIINQESKDIFKPKIMRIFDNAAECQQHEVKFLTKINAATNPKMYNRHNGSSKFCNTSGYPHTEKSKNKISSANKGKPKSVEHRKKLSIAHIGKTTSQTTRNKMSERRKGRPSGRKGIPMSENTKLKIAAGNKGKKHSLESRQKQSIALTGKIPWNKGVPCSKETREKISAIHKGKMFGHKTHQSVEKMRQSLKKLIWITNGKIQQRITIDNLSHFLALGFRRGRL
jgi:hypothetical protein